MKIAFSRTHVACVLLVVIAAGLWLYIRYGEIRAAAIEKTKIATAAYIQKRASAFVKEEDFSSGDPASQQKLFQAFFDAVQSPDLVRMKVWNRNFTVVWSDLRELIGQRFPDNHEVEEALEGKVEIEMASKSKDEHVSERAFQEMSEIYVPFSNSKGEVVGVFEVYQPATAMQEEIASQFRSSAVIAIAFSALALGIVAYTAPFLNQRLKKQVEDRA